MRFGFTQGHADAQDRAFAVGPDAQGDEHGAIQHLAALADFFVAGIDKDVGAGFDRAIAPVFQFDV